METQSLKFKSRNKGKNNPMYVDGRTLKIYYCQICHNRISSYKTKICQECYLKTLKSKGNPMFNKKGKNSPNWKGGKSKGKKCVDCGKEVSDKKVKRCANCANKEEKNPNFGKPCPHTKHGKYKKTWMRSSWEIKFAYFLDLSGYKWLYEPKRFYFKDCTYCPDFYLPEFDCYIEIKGWWRGNTKKRFDLFKKLYPKLNIKLLMKKELQELGILK